MQEFQSVTQARAPMGDIVGVSYFAAQVVSLLADRSLKSMSEPRESLVEGLIAASLSGTKSAFSGLLGEVKRARISLAALADIYIPLAAQRMGQAWHDDEMSWIDVTIGVGRLQSLLREIGTAWVADRAGDAGHGTVLFIVPDREQHTLGPLVATGQMRRYGVSVCLRIAPSFNELRDLMAQRQFDGVMISVATRDKLASIAKTVEFLRTVMVHPAPIVVGGAVMSKVEDPASCTGGDLSSNDVGVALENMGLKFDAFCVLKRA
jgi:MerR family transcriptional regulator, light-induced transcriptional regulator